MPQEGEVEADNHQAGVGDGEATIDTSEEEDGGDNEEEEETQEGDVGVDVRSFSEALASIRSAFSEG